MNESHEAKAQRLNEEQREITNRLASARGKEAKTLLEYLDCIRQIRSNLDDIWMSENKEKSHTESPYYRRVV